MTTTEVRLANDSRYPCKCSHAFGRHGFGPDGWDRYYRETGNRYTALLDAMVEEMCMVPGCGCLRFRPDMTKEPG